MRKLPQKLRLWFYLNPSRLSYEFSGSSARIEPLPVSEKMRVDLGEDRLRQPVPLQQVAEVRMVVSSGMRSQPSLIPANRRIASLS